MRRTVTVHNYTAAVDAYWNHNSAFHREILDVARVVHGDVLDVGCGEGLLVERLGPLSRSVTGIDPDAMAIERARQRVASLPLDISERTRLLNGDFLADSALDNARFDLICCVAALHHMPLEAALERMRSLLRPGGRIVVVGCAANSSVRDWVLSGLALIPIKLAGRMHGETRDIGVRTSHPAESFGEIRARASTVLPGARARRRFYYRYTLTWRTP